MSERSARVIGLRGVPWATRGLASLAASVALVGSLMTVVAPPAVALESTLLSPTTVDPGAVAAVTIDGNDYRIENSVYQFQFEGFSGLTVGGSCPNVTVTTNPAQGSAGVGNVTCTIPASNQIKLVFGSATPTATRGSVTVAIASAAGLTAPQTPGSYGIVVRDWQNDVIPGISGTICVGFCTQPQAPLITIDIDPNGGTCGTAKVIGFATTWGNAPRDCSKPGSIFKGFNTNAGASEASIAPGGNLHLTGDNRIYAIYDSPRTAGAPTDVVAVAGRDKITVSWKAPVDPGSSAITNYLAQASPSGRPCVTRTSDANMLSCTFDLRATNTKYSFKVQALNGAGWGPVSAESAAVSPYDFREVSGSRANVLLGLAGTKVETNGAAPGLAGLAVTPEYKVGGAANWTSVANAARVNADGKFSWSKRFPASANKQNVTVRFTYGGDAVSDTLVLSRGGQSGSLTAPRNIKVENVVNRVIVTWDPPKFDGGEKITGYTMCANGAGSLCRNVPADGRGVFQNLATGREYTITVAAKTATRTGPEATAKQKVSPVEASTRITRRLGQEIRVQVEATGFKAGAKFRLESAVAVPGEPASAWRWEELRSFTGSGKVNREYAVELGSLYDGETIAVRLVTSNGTVYSRLSRP